MDDESAATMPRLLYGTAWKSTQTADLVYTALTQGFRGIDTAGQRKHYREDLVGLGVQRACEQLNLQRSDIWLQTKFTPLTGQDLNGPVPYNVHAPVADQVCASFQSSLRNLHPGSEIPDVRTLIAKYAVRARRTSEREDAPPQQVWIDSYLLHSPLQTFQSTMEAWTVMEALVDARIVRHIGFSNVYDPRIFAALFEHARIKPSVLQNRWHSSTGHDVSLLAQLSPVLSPNTFPPAPDPVVQPPQGVVYQPFWTLTGNPHLLESAPVITVAGEKNLTPAQVVYAFVAQGMGIAGLSTCVLSGTCDPIHMREAVAAVELPIWDEETIALIRKEVYGE